MTPSYIELHARSAFSFLRGASYPEQLAERARPWICPRWRLCDRDGVYGAPRFYPAAASAVCGRSSAAELTLEDGTVLPVLVQNRTGYQNLCRLITRGEVRGTKTCAGALG